MGGQNISTGDNCESNSELVPEDHEPRENSKCKNDSLSRDEYYSIGELNDDDEDEKDKVKTASREMFENLPMIRITNNTPEVVEKHDELKKDNPRVNNSEENMKKNDAEKHDDKTPDQS